MSKVHRVKMKVGELEDVDVIRISLVDRGANRVPFRLTKRDNPSQEANVIDYKNPFRKREKPISVGAIVINKEEIDLDEAKTAITEAGFSTENECEIDGVTIFAQVEGLGDQAQVFHKFDERTGVVLLNAKDLFQKTSASIDFDENMGATQFLPGLAMSLDAFHRTVMNVLDEAESAEKAVSAIKDAAGSFSDVVVDMAAKIPSGVFKLADVLTAVPTAKTETETVEEVAVEAAGDPKETVSDEDGEETGVKGEDEKPDTQTADNAGEDDQVAKSDPAEGTEEAPVLKAVETLTATVSDIAEAVKNLGSRMEKAEADAGEAKSLAVKAEKALSITGGVSSGDPSAASASNGKSIKKRSVPLLDTARRTDDE